MDKNEVMRAGKEFMDLFSHIENEVNMIDKGLKDNIKKERAQALWDKHQEVQTVRLDKIKRGRTYFKAARLRESNPLNALIRKAYRAEDNRPGLAAVIAALATMAPAEQIEIAKELDNPVLSLTTVSNLRAMKLEPEERMQLDPAVAELTTGALDMGKIRDHAATELACIKLEADINRKTGGDPTLRMGDGHIVLDLEKIIAQGILPKHEQINSLSHPDPTDRVNASRGL